MAEWVTLAEAIAANVHDGASVALEGFTHLIPFAAGHHIDLGGPLRLGTKSQVKAEAADSSACGGLLARRRRNAAMANSTPISKAIGTKAGHENSGRPPMSMG